MPRPERSPARRDEADAPRRAALPLHSGARQVARAVLALVLVALALWIAADFLAPLAWAAIIAIATWPLYLRFTALVATGSSSVLAALLFTVLLAAIVFLPVGLAAYQVAQHAEAAYAWIGRAHETGIPVPSWVAQLPVAADAVEQWWRENLSEPKAAQGWLQRSNAESVTEWVKALGGDLLHRAALFFIALMMLFAFLRHGAWIARSTLATADRIFGDPGERLSAKMLEAVRGSVNGTVIVAVAEGLLIGLGYGLAGVPNAIVFTLLTIAFAMLPFGAWAAFTVAAIVSAASGGGTWTALAIFAWGAAVMLVGDHFVWPMLVGGAVRLPFLWALVGIFGGLQAFGLVGLFVGPVVMATLLTVWREWVVHADDQAPANK